MTQTSQPAAGWKLTIPVVNLKGDQRVAGSYVAAIADREAARKAIPYGRAVPSAPLQPLSADELAGFGVDAGAVKKIA